MKDRICSGYIFTDMTMSLMILVNNPALLGRRIIAPFYMRICMAIPQQILVSLFFYLLCGHFYSPLRIKNKNNKAIPIKKIYSKVVKTNRLGTFSWSL